MHTNLKKQRKERLHIVKIDALTMYNEGIDFTKVKKNIWYIKSIDGKYITKII